MTADQIARLCAALLKEDGKRPKVIETHISWILIATSFVYKIKKPVLLSFLDFSTLENRKYYCDKEFQLNCRLAKKMYVDVVPVSEGTKHGIFVRKRKGTVIDYAIRMKKLDLNKQMDVLLDRNLVDKSAMEKLALKIANFHKHTTVLTTGGDPDSMIKKFRDIEQVSAFIQENSEDKEALQNILRLGDRFIKENTLLLKNRRIDGMIRDGHGDLHSGNIFLYANPVVFDCIEFNDTYRCIDVMSDIAFLCMDLEAHKRSNLSRAFLSAYHRVFPVIRTSHEKLLFLYYKMYRANVRTKVNSLMALQSEQPAKRAHYRKEMLRYFKLMQRYAVRMRNSI